MIYLDSAATSLYKPETVHAAVIDAMLNMSSPGRGVHEAAMRAAECCAECREKLANMFHVPDPEKVVFTFNATHGLNIAIRSLIKPGDRVLISGYEHNSVTRPLTNLGAKLVVIDTPLFMPEQFMERAAREIVHVDAVVCTHVSNAFGYILPVEQLAQLCRAQGKPLIIDASQSAGVLALDFAALGAEFVAFPGHKGLLGPQGTGVLLCKNDASALLYGGSGSDSVSQTMPAYLPDRLEAGTHNVAGIAGLSAGLDYLAARGITSVFEEERKLLEVFFASLEGVPGLRFYHARESALQSGVLSVLPEKVSCEAFGDALGEAGIAVRTGLHCAPTAHRTVGTLETGTLRFSFSPFNTLRQVERAAEICKKILKNS